MTKFKVGDWVKHETCGIGILRQVWEEDARADWINGKFISHPNPFKYLTKLYPKFDNFEDLFSDEPPLPRLMPNHVYNIGDEVVYDTDLRRMGTIQYFFCRGDGWCYLIGRKEVPERKIICFLDDIRGNTPVIPGANSSDLKPKFNRGDEVEFFEFYDGPSNWFGTIKDLFPRPQGWYYQIHSHGITYNGIYESNIIGKSRPDDSQG